MQQELARDASVVVWIRHLRAAASFQVRRSRLPLHPARGRPRRAEHQPRHERARARVRQRRRVPRPEDGRDPRTRRGDALDDLHGRVRGQAGRGPGARVTDGLAAPRPHHEDPRALSPSRASSRRRSRRCSRPPPSARWGRQSSPISASAAWRGHAAAREVAAGLGLAPQEPPAGRARPSRGRGSHPMRTSSVTRSDRRRVRRQPAVLGAIAYASSAVSVLRAGRPRDPRAAPPLRPPLGRHGRALPDVPGPGYPRDGEPSAPGRGGPRGAAPGGLGRPRGGIGRARSRRSHRSRPTVSSPSCPAWWSPRWHGRSAPRPILPVSTRSRAGGSSSRPEQRRAPRRVLRLEYDLARLARRAFGRLARGLRARLREQPLRRAARARGRGVGRGSVEGGVGVALRLLERAAECAGSPAQRALFHAQIQGARIAALRFEDAAAGPEPPASAPPALRGFLFQAKGWRLVMGSAAAEADAYLARARELLDDAGPVRERLYLLNISALARLKVGDAGALSLERRIEARLAALPAQPVITPQVHQRGEPSAAPPPDGLVGRGRAVLRARLRDHAGARSESDAVYENVCAAMVKAQRGTRRPRCPICSAPAFTGSRATSPRRSRRGSSPRSSAAERRRAPRPRMPSRRRSRRASWRPRAQPGSSSASSRRATRPLRPCSSDPTTSATTPRFRPRARLARPASACSSARARCALRSTGPATSTSVGSCARSWSGSRRPARSPAPRR